ncbi:MAG: barnase inhibitor [Ruminococcus sp.]|nr:barnase inhibitor [Ruminococcus sp.]
MKVFILCERIHTKEDLHEILQTALSLPGYYGRNLDALFDCLTDLAKPVHLVLCDFPRLQAAIGEYASALTAVLERAAEENSRFSFEMAPRDVLFG